MQTYTYTRLIKGTALSTTTTTYYTSSGKTVIHKVTFTNTDTSPRTVTLYIVPAGIVVGATNIIVSASTIFPNETWSPPDVVGHTLEAGDSIQAKISSGTAVNIMASGVVIS